VAGGKDGWVEMRSRVTAILRRGFLAAPVACMLDADAMAAGAPGAPAGALETVVVTARKTSEDAQETPVSITVLTASDLKAAGIGNVETLAGAVPNVAMSGGIAGLIQGQVGIRGISTLVRNIGVESGLGFYVDGVYQGRPETYQQEFIDVARVEILRGPQGTIFGKNTIAGAFNITTSRPEGNETRALFDGDGGTYGTAKVRGYLAGPLVRDRLLGKLSLGYAARDGVYEHLSGGADGDSLELFSWRTALYYRPTANSEVSLGADGLTDRSKPAFFQVTDLYGPGSRNETIQETTPHTIDNNRPNSLRRDNYGVSLTGTVRFSTATLTSISSYRRSSYTASLDDDQNQVDYVAADRWGDRTRLFTQELRLNGGIGARADYVAGLFYLSQEARTRRSIAVGPDTGIPGEPPLTTSGSVRTQDVSLYGNLTYRLTDLLTASLGARLSGEEKNVRFRQGDPSGVYALIGYPAIEYENRVSNSNVSPTGTLSYRIMPEVMAYARFARGFKSAAYNVDIVSSTQGLAARPENATSYELGLKSDLLQNRMRVNLALFTTRYDDMQVLQLLGTATSLSNAASADIHGGELEVTGFLSPHLRVDFALGALDARYRRFEDCEAPRSLGGGSADCSGNRIIGAPAWTVKAAAEYTYPLARGRLVGRLDHEFRSPVYFEATNAKRFESDSRNIFGARLGWSSDTYDAFLWVTNLTGETYVTYSDDRSALGVGKTTAYGPRRMFGVTLSARL
jgi:iron complex outermembrane receptor protein